MSQAAQEVVDDYYIPLFRFAMSLAKNEADARDLTQQTFYRYAMKGSQIKDASKTKSWLFTTLHREFLQIRRKAGRHQEQAIDEAEQQTPPALVTTPDFAAKLDGATAVEALQQMDEDLRATLTLYYLREHSYKEIAEIQEIAIGTVMSRLFRGKQKLKTILSEQGRGHETAPSTL